MNVFIQLELNIQSLESFFHFIVSKNRKPLYSIILLKSQHHSTTKRSLYLGTRQLGDAEMILYSILSMLAAFTSRFALQQYNVAGGGGGVGWCTFQEIISMIGQKLLECASQRMEHSMSLEYAFIL